MHGPTTPSAQHMSRKQSQRSGRESSRRWFRRLRGLERLEGRLLLATYGDIDGTILNDLNANGVKDAGEDGLPGWTAYVDLNLNGTFESSGANPEPWALTNPGGDYLIPNLLAGPYRVAQILQSGWMPTPPTLAYQDVVVFDTNITANFFNVQGVATTGDILGTVWNDANGDGIRTLGTESGLANWTIFLDLNHDRIANPTEPSTLTDLNGDYFFAALTPGDYSVCEIVPSGWAVTPALGFDNNYSVAVVAGGQSIAPDFANYRIASGTLRGTAWNDLNGDGIRAAGTDLGLANWTIFLDLNHDAIANPTEPTTLTDLNGDYSFAGLAPGDYNVHEVLPTGWEASPGFGANYTVAVAVGGDSVAPDFANYNVAAASVSGVVWNDLNGDGVRALATEPGLAGWSVFVDLNLNGVLDVAEPSAVSGSDGAYTIAGIHPGSIQIVELPGADWMPTAPSTGKRLVTLLNGANVSGQDFGNKQRTDALISGAVYVDSNKNGVRDPGERGLDGITVYVDLNNNAALDSGEPQTATSADLYFTPAVNEAGSYSFSHLAGGAYAVREIVPALLSATPVAQRERLLAIGGAEARSGVDFGNVFRPSEIRGVKFDDANGNHLRDPDELSVGGATVFIDSDRDDVLDDGEPTTVTAADGSYAFTDLLPDAYVVREIVGAGRVATYPTTTAGTLWPTGVSNPAVGNVTPLSITASLREGESLRQSVSLTLPNTGALTNLVDVFLLFDDTGSFTSNSPIVRAAFPEIIASLQTSLPGINLGFGVGRFEEYANFAAEYSTGRPFILNQPIVASGTTGFAASIQAALDRTTPGYGGDQPETDFEALYQTVTGLGFDGNNNGTVADSGAAGLVATQLTPGSSGDVPSFASFTADPSGSVLPAAGTLGGAGFRAGALPVILTATDTGFAYQPNGETTITGVGGVTLPVSALTQTSRGSTPYGSGAGIQQTITGLNALGALVIGLGTNPEANTDPRQGLESIAKLTGAVNQSTATVANGTADPIAPGDPFYFQISSGFGASVANGVVAAIQNAVTNVAVNVSLRASDPRVRIVNHTGVLPNVGAGQTATFDVEFVGDGVPRRFDLQFVREGTNVVLGSIPVVLGTPIPGDCYEFEDLEEGEICSTADFGSQLRSVAVINVAPSFIAGADQSISEDAGPQTMASWATAISPGPASEAGQIVNFIVSNDSPGVVNLQPTLSAGGTLSYTPPANAFGSARLSVQLNVDGGTLNGGVDTSAVQSFQIVIAAVNDAPVAAAVASVAPAAPTGVAADLSVLGADDGGEANLTYTWSAAAIPTGALAPSFSVNGTNAAKQTTVVFSKAGTYDFLATMADAGGLSTTSGVSVTVDQTLTSVTVSPNVVSLYGGMMQQFSVLGNDQFGEPLAAKPSFAWSATAGVVAASGLYTAPTTDAVVVVTAASGAVSGTGTVNVTGLPQIAAWQSARTHALVGEASLMILDDDKYSEPRSGGVRRLLVTFDRAVDPASFNASSVRIAGNNAAGAAIDLSSVAITASLRNGNTVGVFDFGASLPDKARYLVRVQGVTDPAGNALIGDSDRVFTNLKGDCSGDLRTNVTDLSSIRSGFANPINAAVAKQVRADVNLDGRANATDLSAAWAIRNTDVRLIPTPVLAAPSLLLSSITSSTAGLWPSAVSAGGATSPTVAEVAPNGQNAATAPTAVNTAAVTTVDGTALSSSALTARVIDAAILSLTSL